MCSLARHNSIDLSFGSMLVRSCVFVASSIDASFVPATIGIAADAPIPAIIFVTESFLEWTDLLDRLEIIFLTDNGQDVLFTSLLHRP